jgi:hypothetical protein
MVSTEPDSELSFTESFGTHPAKRQVIASASRQQTLQQAITTQRGAGKSRMDQSSLDFLEMNQA